MHVRGTCHARGLQHLCHPLENMPWDLPHAVGDLYVQGEGATERQNLLLGA